MAASGSQVPQIVVSATYADESLARADYARVADLRRKSELAHVHAALLVRGADGELRVEQHSFETSDTAGLGAVIGIVAGATLGVVFPPLGLALAAAALAGGVGGALLGGAVGAAVGHLEGGLSKEQLADVGRVLRQGQAALVVVADAAHGDDLTTLVKGAQLSQHLDVPGASVDAAYGAVARALDSEAADAAHAAAAVEVDVRVLLDYADLSDRAATLTDAEMAGLHDLTDELTELLAQSAPNPVEQAAIDKADAIIDALVIRAKAADVASEARVQLQHIALAFDAADRLARAYYMAASTQSRPPAPRLAQLALISGGAIEALAMQQSLTTTKSLASEEPREMHIFEAVGATPAEKGAITRGAHVAHEVAGRWVNDISDVVTQVRRLLNAPND